MQDELAVRPSKKQRELLSFIDGFIKGHGYGPSYRETMRALNYKSVSTVAIHINALIKKGHLIKRDHSARSLAVANAPKPITVPSQPVTKTQQKWLVDEVTKRFEQYEAAPDPKLYDGLCILVGSLAVLGMDDAATAAKSRLHSLNIPKTPGS